jgi:hypothetical protein
MDGIDTQSHVGSRHISAVCGEQSHGSYWSVVLWAVVDPEADLESSRLFGRDQSVIRAGSELGENFFRAFNKGPHHIRSGLDLRHQANALPGEEIHGLKVAGGVGRWRKSHEAQERNGLAATLCLANTGLIRSLLVRRRDLLGSRLRGCAKVCVISVTSKDVILYWKNAMPSHSRIDCPRSSPN